VYFGKIKSFSSSIIPSKIGTTNTLFAEKILEMGFHIVTRVFVVEEVGCEAYEWSLQVRDLLSKKRVVNPPENSLQVRYLLGIIPMCVGN
jgi:hypothetical protein